MPRYFDTSRVAEDWRCPRARYWKYEHAGRGVVNLPTSFNLMLGIILHKGLEAVVAGKQHIDGIVKTALVEFRKGATTDHYEQLFLAEQQAVLEGHLRGFHRHQWPQLQREFPGLFAIEREVTLPLGEVPGFDPRTGEPCRAQLVFMAKPDLLLLDKSNRLVYIEYKTTSSNKEQWLDSWIKAPQLHVYARAIEHSLGQLPEAMIIQGLYKGFYSHGKFNSNLAYGYRRRGKPGKPDSWMFEYLAGYRKAPSWDYPGGVKAYIEAMPEHVLAAQFIQTPPIYYDAGIAEAFFRQRRIREGRIAADAEVMMAQGWGPHDLPDLMDRTFPQTLSACTPGWGSICDYVGLCSGPARVDPLQVGYEWRRPHHEPEARQMKEEG